MGTVARLGAFVLFVLVAFALSARHAGAGARVARLSGDAVPVSYDLNFSPHIGRLSVDSRETVIVRVKRPLAYVTLNAARLAISSVTIDGTRATATPQKAIEQVDFAIPGRVLTTGMHTIHVVFSSRIAADVDSAVGDYLGFSNAGTAKEPFLVTMFEPSTARRMFPCFDEPAFRARFRVTVTAPAGLTVISNMPMTKRTIAGADATSSFAQTPPMPTYLLTVDIAKLSGIGAVANGIPVRVLTTPALIGSAKTALADAVASLKYFETFFGVRYPMPKLDLIVAPAKDDTALEQWGSITFYSPLIFQEDGRLNRFEALDFVTHEIAHQWVGDLVTMHWWRDTVVAEGLAEYSAARAEDELHPELEPWEYTDHAIQEIIGRPLTASSVPVVHDIDSDIDAEDEPVFDNATYDKPMAVLQQYERVAGMPAVHASLQRYLRRYAYGSATVEQLLRSFPDGLAYGRTWLERPGFPVVAATQRCANGRKILLLHQDAYMHLGGLWMIPVVAQNGSHRDAFFMRTRDARRDEGSCAASLVLDSDFFPYYRVRFAAPDSWTVGQWPQRAQQWVMTGAAQLEPDAPGEFLTLFSATAPNLRPFALRPATIAFERLYGTLGQNATRDGLESTMAPQLRPVALRTASREHRTASTMVRLLSMLPDANADANAFATFRQALTSGKNLRGFATQLAAVDAGQRATAQQTQAVLDAAFSLPADTAKREAGALFLRNVRSAGVLGAVGAWLAAHPKQKEWALVASLAAHFPQFGDAYLRAHAADDIPQMNAKTFDAFANGFAMTYWSVETPQTFSAWLNSLRPSSDAKTIASASATISLQRQRSAALQAGVVAWLAARRDARSSVRILRRNDGCVANNSSYHSGC